MGTNIAYCDTNRSTHNGRDKLKKWITNDANTNRKLQAYSNGTDSNNNEKAQVITMAN